MIAMLRKVLFLIVSFPDRLHRAYKMHVFNANTQHGEGLSVGPKANVSKESGCKITIGRNCDILGVLIAKCGSRITIGDYTCRIYCGFKHWN